MNSIYDISMDCNKKVKINFEGGDLSSDAGLLLIKEFAEKIGFTDLVKACFKTTDTASFRVHSDVDNFLQMVYQVIAAYSRDDFADDLKNDPTFTTILDKTTLASQPTLSRFFNRMDQDTLQQMNGILREMRKTVYNIERPEHLLLDLDSTLLETYGRQEDGAFNAHYQSCGYHPLLCYNGITGDLLKAELRGGSQYCSNGAGAFLEELLQELDSDFPETLFYMRGDSGFAAPEVYDALEEADCKYAIRLKMNAALPKYIAEKDKALYLATSLADDPLRYAVTYGEFMYKAGSWSHPRRVCYKIEKPEGQMVHMYTFIVTTMKDLDASQVIQFYCGRGRMENFIKEGKNGFSFGAVSSKTRIVNENRLLLHGIAYNLFNYFKRLVLPKKMRNHCIGIIRLKLLKIAARIVHTAGYVKFKLCSSCPYKQEFYETMDNIKKLETQLV